MYMPAQNRRLTRWDGFIITPTPVRDEWTSSMLTRTAGLTVMPTVTSIGASGRNTAIAGRFVGVVPAHDRRVPDRIAGFPDFER